MQKYISLILVLVLTLSILPVLPAAAEENATEGVETDETTALVEGIIASGECGDNLTWTFDGKTGTLTISGTGKMDDYSYTGDTLPVPPWYDLRSSITTVSLSPGVTSIGGSAFVECWNLTSISIPDGVISIEKYAFYECRSLTSISIPDGVTGIERFTFFGCNSLTNVSIPDRRVGSYC